VGDLRLPADWEPHERCLMAWPGEEARPGSRAPEAIEDFARTAREIARFEPVLMLAYPEFVGHAEAACGPGVAVVELPFDDVWIRDSGPLFAVRGAEELVAVDFRFNRYGSKTVERERFAETGVLLADRLGIPRLEVPYVLEGGAITTNGEGALIAVETSILTENRNPGATRDELEGVFAEFLGIERTIWVEHGLEEDRTDGHVDNVALFVGPARVLCQTVRDTSDPNASRLVANRAVLEAAGLEVLELPVLPYSEHRGRRLARTYLNCFVGNGCVVAPLAGVAADEEGLAVLGEAFPGREVVGVPGETLARAGGGVHCITQQVPLLAR
jgi:agmatine deiminase